MHRELAEPHPDGDVVEMRVPADGAYVATLRLVAASLAVRCDLTIDEIEDLRLAVDEACALLLPHAILRPARHQVRPGTGLPRGNRNGRLGQQFGGWPDRSGFAWSVLSALASEVEVDGTAGRMAITVTKRRETAPR